LTLILGLGQTIEILAIFFVFQKQGFWNWTNFNFFTNFLA